MKRKLKTVISLLTIICIILTSISFEFVYADEAFNYVIAPKFNDAYNFSEGLAVVEVNGMWGYIDKSGKIVITPQFESASSFFEGLAAVKINGKWGYIDKSGRMIIEPKFRDRIERLGDFSEGLATVLLWNNVERYLFAYIDRNGKTIVDPKYSYAGDFSEGLASVRGNGIAGYIDKNGKMVSERNTIIHLDKFSDGLAPVVIETKSGSRCGYIDKFNNLKIQPQFIDLHPFSEGMAAVVVDSKWGYIDTKGTMVIKPQFDKVHDFHEGLAVVEVNDKWGCIDKSGKMVINPQFDFIYYNFSEGLAPVEVNNKIGYIDTKGAIVIKPQFDSASDFVEGIAAVAVDERFGYISCIPTLGSQFTSEINQKEANINAMLTTYSSSISYWDYFADSNRYPYYIYLDNYYGAKDSLPFLKGTESFFRVNIAPAFIGLADIIYNEKALEGQSKERAKDILVSLVIENGEAMLNNQLADKCNELIDEAITVFETSIKSAPIEYEKMFDSDYTKLNSFSQELRPYLIKKANAGIMPSQKVLMQAEAFNQFKNLEKADLVRNLENKMIKSERLMKAWKIVGDKYSVGMDFLSGLSIGADEYMRMTVLLEANCDFIDFLITLESRASSQEVKSAAKELREEYENKFRGQLKAMYGASTGTLEALIKDLSWQVSFTTMGMEIITNVGEKIDKFERLRLTSNMALVLDQVMAEEIQIFNKADLSEREIAVNTIYKFAPFLFALRLKGETYLSEYLRAIGAKKEDAVSGLNSVESGLAALKSTLYNGLTFANQNTNLQNGIYKVDVSKAYSTDTNEHYIGIMPYTTYELIWDYIYKTDFNSKVYYEKNYPVTEMMEGKIAEIPIQEVPEKIGITKDKLLEILQDYPGPSDDADFWNMPAGEVIVKLSEKCIIKLEGTELGDIFLIEKKPPVKNNKDLVSRVSQNLEESKNRDFKYIYNIEVEIKNGEIIKFTEIYHP